MVSPQSVEAELHYHTVQYSKDVTTLIKQATFHNKHFLHTVTSTKFLRATLPIIVPIKTSRNICYKEKYHPFFTFIRSSSLCKKKKLFLLVWYYLSSKAASIVLLMLLTSDEDLLSTL
jgi:hypothetical protein